MPVDAPIFTICTARSGSTLLRYLMDTHPDIACPPEIRVGSVLASVGALWRDTLSAQEPNEAGRMGREAARAAVDAVMNRYVEGRGKRTWCDKSIATLSSLEIVVKHFPDARYLCLYRNPMDMMASGIEASRWGYGRFGFQSYVQQRPDNLVAAIAQYWIDRTAKILACEESGKLRTHRLTYENLVTYPVETLQGLLKFLELDDRPELAEEIVAGGLVTKHEHGLGDFKVNYTASIDSGSVGRGRSLPVWQIDDEQLVRINELCAKLGYDPVDSSWNSGWPVANLSPVPLEPPTPLTMVMAGLERGLAGYDGPRVKPFCLAVAGDRERWLWEIDPGSDEVRRLDGREPPAGMAVWATHLTVVLDVANGGLNAAQALDWKLIQREPEREAGGVVEADRKLLNAVFSSLAPFGGPLSA